MPLSAVRSSCSRHVSDRRAPAADPRRAVGGQDEPPAPRLRADDLVVAVSELPALLLRAACLGDGHLDADGGPVVSRSRPHPQRDGPRSRHGGSVRADPGVRSRGRLVRRPAQQAADPLRHADSRRRARRDLRHPHRDARHPDVVGVPAGAVPRLRERLRQPRQAGLHLGDGPAGRPPERRHAQLGVDEPRTGFRRGGRWRPRCRSRSRLCVSRATRCRSVLSSCLWRR